ncbi:MAG: hypothetical protein WDW38_002447 [Sanguina aurantia]
METVGRLTLTHAKSTAGMKPSDVVAVTRADLERMLKASPVMTVEDIAAAKATFAVTREAAQAVSKARKEKMLKLEEEARKQAKPTETEMLKRQVDGATLDKASAMLEEQKDEVKHMNQMVLYSKCVTIRDAQIEEKKSMMVEEEEEQRRLDLMMEVERIRALGQYEERERQRVEERRRGSKVLEEQIAGRERERVRLEELRDVERLQMLREIERLKQEEMQVVIEKKIMAKALLEEVASSNAEQIRRKEFMKTREKEEDMKITEYIRAKDRREAAHATEKQRIAHEKELETARLRAQQERAADKASELDELRARRYQEAKEREWRTKEKAAAERQAAMMLELADARSAQQNAKLKQRAEMAQVEQHEFMRVLSVSRAKEAEELQQTAATLSINGRYKEELLAQIQANEEKRKKDRQEHLEEGEQIRANAEKERARLQTIKARKLHDLEEAGVPSKYRAELERMKIVKV